MKKLKIIIPVLIVIAIIAGVAYFVLANNNLAITSRGKVAKGLSKSFTDLEGSDEILDEYEGYQYLKNIGTKPYEDEIKLSVDLDIDNLEDLVGDKETAKTITEIIDEITNSDIVTKVSMDKANKQMLVSLDATAKDIFGELTGEVAISEDEIAFRSKELNKNYLKITEKDAEENDEIKEIFDFIQEFFEKDYSDIMFSDEELKHFSDTYGEILNDFITDDIITSDKGEITVDGDTKSCTVTTTTLDNEKVKELLSKYITTYKEDEEGQTILKNKFTNLYGEEITKELLKSFNNSIDDIQDEIDDIEGALIKFITYGTMTDVYANEYQITFDGETLSIKENFNSDSTKYVISFDEEEIINATVKKLNKGIDISAQINMDGTVLNVSLVATSEKVVLKLDVEDYGTIEIVADINIKTNTATEFNQDIDITINIDIPDYDISGTLTLSIEESINIVDSIDFPDTSKAVSVYDEELEDYIEDCTENAQKILEKVEDSKVYELISEYYSSSYSYDDWDIDDEDYDYDWNFDEDDFDWDFEEDDDEIEDVEKESVTLSE